MIKSVGAALLAAAFVLGANSLSLAQAPPAGGKTPTNTTGSGKDTGMNVPSGMSGNGPGGVGASTSPTAVGATSGNHGGKSQKKSRRHTKKHRASAGGTR